eukprot:1136652-Pelagomonas_calceolata.AAC.2
MSSAWPWKPAAHTDRPVQVTSYSSKWALANKADSYPGRYTQSQACMVYFAGSASVLLQNKRAWLHFKTAKVKLWMTCFARSAWVLFQA